MNDQDYMTAGEIVKYLVTGMLLVYIGVYAVGKVKRLWRGKNKQ